MNAVTWCEAGAATTRAPTVPRRALFVHQSCELYGSDRVLLDTVLALRRAGGEPIVVLPSGGPLVDVLRGHAIEAHAVQAAQLLKLSRRSMSAAGVAGLARAVPRMLRTLDDAVAGRRIDLVHSNTLAVLGGALWSRRRRVRHLWHVHEMVEQPRAAAWLFPRLVRLLADRVVCNSHATQGWLLQSQPVLRERTQVVWNGVSTDDGADVSGEAALRARFRPLGQTLAVGLVGRINRMKGHGVLLEAAERLQAQGRHDFSIVFVGDAPPDQPQHRLALQQRVAGSALAQRVVFAGFVHDIPAAMRALDVICVPSTEAEAFGLVAVEAMAAARPSLASRCGGLPEVLGDEAAAWLHAPGDAATLAQQLHRLLNDAALRQRVGDAGRARYLRHFTSAAMAERMVRALAEAHAR